MRRCEGNVVARPATLKASLNWKSRFAAAELSLATFPFLAFMFSPQMLTAVPS